MKKEELKYGNIVEFRNGERGILLKPVRQDKQIFLFNTIESVCCFIDLMCFNDKLEDNNHRHWDIMKVYENYHCSKLLWERPKPLLTDEERKYLKEIFKGLTCKVISIFRGNYYLEIKLENDCYINLAKYNCMKYKFEGMETCRRYTLKELGLEG